MLIVSLWFVWFHRLTCNPECVWSRFLFVDVWSVSFLLCPHPMVVRHWSNTGLLCCSRSRVPLCWTGSVNPLSAFQVYLFLKGPLGCQGLPHSRCNIGFKAGKVMQKLCESHVKANDLRIFRWLQMLQFVFVKAWILWFFQRLGCSHRPSRGEFRHSRWWGGAGKGLVWCGLVVWTTQFCIQVKYSQVNFLFTSRWNHFMRVLSFPWF